MNIQNNPHIPSIRPALRNNLAEAAQAGKIDDQMQLSGDEEQMITNQFKAPSTRVLEVYSANGAMRTEQPQAKGLNIDFTV